MPPCDVLIVTADNNDAYSHSNLYYVWKKRFLFWLRFGVKWDTRWDKWDTAQVDMVHLFFTFFATFCTVVTTNSSRLYKLLPSMLLLLIIIYSTMLENVGKYYLTTCMFVIRLQPIVRIFLRCIHM